MAWTTPATPAAGTVITGASHWGPQITDNMVVLRAGGFALASQAIGDLIYASSTTQFARLADVATGSVLVSGGVGVAPAWSTAPTCSIASVTGTLADARLSSNVPLKNAANTFSVPNQHVSGALGGLPGWKVTETSTSDTQIWRGVRSGGTAADWLAYMPSGSTSLILYSAGDRFTFAADGSLTVSNLLTVSGFGAHAVAAGGTGANSLRIENSTSGAANYGQVNVVGGTSTASLYAMSQGYTNSGYFIQSAGVLESTGAGGLSIATSNASGDIRFYAGGTTEVGRIDSTLWLIGDTSNANMTQGLTINQGASDDEIFTLKSSDVAHGMTDYTETDTFFRITKGSATAGAASIWGFGEGAFGLWFAGSVTTTDTTKATDSTAPVEVEGYVKSGTNIVPLGANENVFLVNNSGGACFIVDADGDIHMDATSNINAWDDYDDVALLEAFRTVTARPNFKHRFAQNISESADVLARTGVLTLNDDGHHFVSYKGLTGLTIDAIRQLHQRIAHLEERLLTA